MARAFVLALPTAAALNSTSAGSLCGGAAVVEASADWVWSHEAMDSPSCTSPAVENVAEMCEGDPTSVVIRSSGQPQCLSTQMPDCKFNMRSIDQLDFDVNMLGCRGTWAAPLWMSPNRWLGGGDSGEIDMLENCPTDALWSNFAGGGDQVSWAFANTDSFSGHTSMWKRADDDGVVSIYVQTCDASEVDGTGSCARTSDAAYLRDIYGKNGCNNGGDCVYTLISDIWNGVSGDAGYQSCANGQTHPSSGCSVSVTNIRFKAATGTFAGKCAVLASDTVLV
jgi:hypothetical protein